MKVTERFGPCTLCGCSGKISNHESTYPWMTCSRCGGSGQIVAERTVEATPTSWPSRAEPQEPGA